MINLQLPWDASAAITPSLTVLSIGMHVGWALVLGAVSAHLLRRRRFGLRVSITFLVMAFCMLPNQWSLSWWLGLAFQTPSLVLQALCGLYLYRQWRSHDDAVPSQLTETTAWPMSLLMIAIGIGWLLALDTFALLTIQLYSIGFMPYAVLAALFFACLLQLISSRSDHSPPHQHYRMLAAIVLISILVHLFTRLPSGNVWDALIDPWLWILAHLCVLNTLVSGIRARRRSVA
ncbi:MAG: hypothetical protein ACKN9M_08085 [Burkholderiaceae bacterium]